MHKAIEGRSSGVRAPGGIPLGYFVEQNGTDTPYYKRLAYRGDQHLILVAPPGTGKATTLAIPTLLEYDGSCFVTDPKGELLAVTGRRRRAMGHRVIVINPFGVLEEDLAARGFLKFHRFNPLAGLNPASQSFVADISRLAEALIYSEGKDPHWPDSARALVTAYMMYVCMAADEERSLGHVRDLLTASGPEQKRHMARMLTSQYPPLMRKIRQFTDTQDEIKSIFSTARTQTAFLDDPAIVENMSVSDFRFVDLKREKMTVYLVLSAIDIPAYSRWLRLLLTSALNELMATKEKGGKPVLFLLDEFAHLGYLEVAMTAMGLSRGYGIQMFPIVQGLAQLEGIYGDKWKTFLACCGVQQFFAPNDLDTARYLSDRCGRKTAEVRGMSQHIDPNQLPVANPAINLSISHQQRALYFPEEFFGLTDQQQILFHHGLQHPIRAARFHYFLCDNPPPGVTSYKGLYDPNPYHENEDPFDLD